VIIFLATSKNASPLHFSCNIEAEK